MTVPYEHPVATAPRGPAAPTPTSGVDRRALRLAALLLIGGAGVYAVATPFHPGGSPDPLAELQGYAGSGAWVAVHAVQFASAVASAFGIVALVHGLGLGAGIRGLLGRFAAAAAVAGIAVDGVLYAVDGVALKQAVEAWVGAPAAAAPAFLAAVEGVRSIEWGLRSYADHTVGIALVLLAVVIVWTARVPRGIGYLMGLSGLLSIALGLGWAGGHTALFDHAGLGLAG
ncbi:MAG: hypothetical protein AB7J32_21565, partial [Pseudonocardia sp.]